MWRSILILSAIIITFLTFACKKESDENPPTIEVLKPIENTSYNTFDTISVRALLKDDKVLKFASAELQDADLVTVLPPSSRSLNEAEFQFVTSLIINNIHLNSGKFYVLITARDEVNTTRSFTEVHVNGLPFITKGYLVYETLGEQVELHHYANGTDSVKWVKEGPFKDGLIDNYHQQAGYLQEPDGPFFTLPLYPLFNPWELPPSQGGITYCRAQTDEVGIQIGYKDGTLAIFIEEGNLRKTYQSDEDYYPALSLLNGNHVIVWQVKDNPDQNRIEVFFASGGLKQVSSYNPQIINMVNRSDNEIFIGANENGSGILQTYNLDNGIFFDSHDFTDNPIVALCQGKEGVVFIATEQGIYKYDTNSQSVPSPISDILAKNLEWDLVNQVLVITTENELMVLNSFWDPIITYPLNGEPEKLMVWYSK